MFIKKCPNCKKELNVDIKDAYVCDECNILLQISYEKCKECGGELLELIFDDGDISYWCYDGCRLMTGEKV